MCFKLQNQCSGKYPNLIEGGGCTKGCPDSFSYFYNNLTFKCEKCNEGTNYREATQ
eukprot:Pgem_evm1s18813